MREGKGSEALLLRLLDTERLFWRTPKSRPLRPGPECTGVPHWALEGGGRQRPALHVQGPSGKNPEERLEVLPGLYLNALHGELGKVQVNWPPALLNTFLRGPVVLPEVATAVAAQLEFSGRGERTVALPSPNPIRLSSEAPPLERCLTFFSGTFEVGFRRQTPLDSVCIGLGYAGKALSGDSGSTLEHLEGVVLRRFERDYAAEKRAFVALERVGLRPLTKIFPQWKLPWERREHWSLRGTLEEHPTLWLHFVAESLPRLRAAGWQIEFDPSFRFNFSEPEAWHATLESQAEGWFDLALGIEVEGTRLDLLPILGELAQKYSLEALERLPQAEPLVYRLPDGRRLLLPLERVRPLLETLLELYSRPPGGGALHLPRLDAMRLAQFEALTELRWWGGDALLELGRKLRDFRRITPMIPSPQLRATLRPYQLEGLSWLCFLREHGLSGLLADDMGLGKTLQTLAYLQLEHRSHGAQRPSLIVAPTSVLDTWRREAGRFTPDLNVVVLHGAQRAQHFASLEEYDLIVTSYALVWRDLEALERLHYHTLVLDEAQTVKNSRSRAHAALSTLQSRQRLCLTGTPLENHLGELWSLFHFLMPGFLGTAQEFKKHYRLPIEKGRDAARREQLGARVRPFLLRRLKEEVARELPPKSETVVYLPLEGGQRDLYETLRLSLSARLERTLATQGLERSHLHVLDTLLKLRQVCCAPSLVNLERIVDEDESSGPPHTPQPSRLLERARRLRDTAPSAKLEWLRETLPALLEAGRKVLIFSQFTGLLACVEQQLDALNVPYSRLTGETQDRSEQVRRFQYGETPVFLISLRAGGVGLTLTAADTVIHLDPWWNPAVEQQATDRAHRIGQTQPVMVYKLIAAGSLEEKILELQLRKAELARGVLEGSLGANFVLSREDLEDLLSPLCLG